MTTWITICDTCKREGWDAASDLLTDGEKLAQMIEAQAEGQPDIKTRRVSCMMGCKRACNVTVQGQGKLSYVLGQFEPADDAAESIVEYANAHAQSQTGQVPFRTWPAGVKGHFTSRMTPVPDGE